MGPRPTTGRASRRHRAAGPARAADGRRGGACLPAFHAGRVPASHLVVDLLRRATEVDVAIYNATGTRTSLRPGRSRTGGAVAVRQRARHGHAAGLHAGRCHPSRRDTGPHPRCIEVDITCEGTTPRVAVSRRPGARAGYDADRRDERIPVPWRVAAGTSPTWPIASGCSSTRRCARPSSRPFAGQAPGIANGTVGHHDPDRKVRVRVPGGTYPVRCQ